MRKTIVKAIVRTGLLLALLAIPAVSALAAGPGPTPWDPPDTGQQ